MSYNALLPQVLVTDSAFRLHVFDAYAGASVHTLKGHKDKAHVLAAHPTMSRVAMTAGYDGLLVLWDIDAGCQLHSLSLQHSGPAGWSWCDPLPAVEGRFTPGGDGVVLADAAGQWHVFGFGAWCCCVVLGVSVWCWGRYMSSVYFSTRTSQAPHHLWTGCPVAPGRRGTSACRGCWCRTTSFCAARPTSSFAMRRTTCWTRRRSFPRTLPTQGDRLLWWPTCCA